nr:30S ribosomal protein S6 [Clostridiales bacterium]
SEWGKRHLEYPINDMKEGYYTVVTFRSQPAFPAELERLLGIDENVMRSLVLRLDEEVAEKAARRALDKAAAAAESEKAAEEAEEAAPAEEPATEPEAPAEEASPTVADE